jgi:hypothetical protein
MTDEVSEGMANAAVEMSYEKSAEYVTCGKVSAQTVMNKLRECDTYSKQKLL